MPGGSSRTFVTFVCQDLDRRAVTIHLECQRSIFYLDFRAARPISRRSYSLCCSSTDGKGPEYPVGYIDLKRLNQLLQVYNTVLQAKKTGVRCGGCLMYFLFAFASVRPITVSLTRLSEYIKSSCLSAPTAVRTSRSLNLIPRTEPFQIGVPMSTAETRLGSEDLDWSL